ncbi:sulfatase-like hydrolase/transferase [Acinetobacter guerrae]|uniref:sulfatase-like hydrolase/transferase n=1 Tax=Acinetobacter guerrae TaxID=1843371 RepID=UPI00125EEAF3|nr:sulfatase-like hydrolase/transferase [Acinetobacter guerrae]
MFKKLSLLSLSVFLAGNSLQVVHAAQTKNQQPPNIMIILADDLGFSDISAYGSEIKTPHIDSLLNQGKMLFNFHASSMCSPTRAQLMTGADNHLVGLGAMYETSKRQEAMVGADNPRSLLKIDGYSGHLSPNAYTIAETLKTKGYYTFMVGKWHLGYTPEQNPKARGFDRSFALLDGFDLHFKDQPKNYPRNTQYTENGVKTTLPDDYYSTDYFTQKAFEYLAQQPKDKPFFAYMAYTAPHWPIQAPEPYLNMYKGKYDQGYDAIRKQRFERQKKLGLIPLNAAYPDERGNQALSTKNWEQLSTEERKFEARKMEVYAGMVTQLDDRIGDVIQYLKKHHQYDNTLIMFMSDNGAEGGDHNFPMGEADNRYENIGHATSYIYMGPRWAEVSSTPFTYWKSAASEGGVRVPFLVKYPQQISKDHGINHNFATVRDIFPTVMELAGIERSQLYSNNNSKIQPSGFSLIPAFKSNSARIRPINYYDFKELHGSRYAKNDEWKLVENSPSKFKSHGWELYNLKKDFNEQQNVYDQHPEIVQILSKKYLKYADENGVVDFEQYIKK